MTYNHENQYRPTQTCKWKRFHIQQQALKISGKKFTLINEHTIFLRYMRQASHVASVQIISSTNVR